MCCVGCGKYGCGQRMREVWVCMVIGGWGEFTMGAVSGGVLVDWSVGRLVWW